jgi:PAS domain S-box-containing protein
MESMARSICHGGTCEIQVSSRDVTARKMAEQALRDSEERFKNAFDYSSVGMAIIAPSGHYLQVNRALCDIVGYPEAELLQTDFFSITHPADVAPGRMQLQQLLKGYVPAVRAEKRYCHKLGHEVWVRINVSTVHDGQDAPSHLSSRSKTSPSASCTKLRCSASWRKSRRYAPST